ncbi:FtsB family cell division protein [Cellulomonas marina]|nr:septum formation initiator family protein [Cellulomonas marina]
MPSSRRPGHPRAPRGAAAPGDKHGERSGQRLGERPAPRPGARPGGAGRRPRGPVPVVQATVPRLFSARVLVLALVVVVAFVLVYPTLGSYLQQQAELRALEQQVEQAQATNSELQADLDRWDDPAYVRAQARDRLAFVLPGERAYRVVDPGTVPEAAVPAGPSTDSSTLADGTTRPWYQSVWTSVEEAGAAPVTPPAPTPEAPPATS